MAAPRGRAAADSGAADAGHAPHGRAALSAEHTGGSTQFPALRLDVKGRRGELLHFHNLGADGVGCRDTLHAGMPVISGEKWLLSQWIRQETYPARVAW